jgi:polyisoprenoid-binding protein YceI
VRGPSAAASTTATGTCRRRSLRIKGTLRIRNRSQPIELIALPANPSPDRVTLNAETTIDRSKWGMNWKKGASLVNRVAVVAEFVRA